MTYEESERWRLAAYNEQHTRSKQHKKGYEHNVPCPWCGVHDDFSNVPREQGVVVECDSCGNLIEVVKVIQKPVVVVTQCHNKQKPPYVAANVDAWKEAQEEKARVLQARIDIAKEKEEGEKNV